MIRIGGGDGPRKVEPIVPVSKVGDKPHEKPKGSKKGQSRDSENRREERPMPKPGEPGYNLDIEV